MSAASHLYSFVVSADHPAFPGHFPGQPLVPAVVMLEQVAVALRAWRGERLGRVAEAKFVAPLGPDQRAGLCLTEVQGRVRVGSRALGCPLALGVVEGVAL